MRKPVSASIFQNSGQKSGRETGFCYVFLNFFQQTVAKTCVNQIHKHLMITCQESTKLYQLKTQNESTQQGLPRDYILEDVDQLTKE